MYKVIEDFADLQDHEYIYHAGDEFPRFGVSVSEERVQELSTSRNRIGRALMGEPVEEEKPVELQKPVEEAPKRRGRKKANDK